MQNLKITYFKILVTSLLLVSCVQQRRDICDCLDIEAALTDSMLLSQEDLKSKSKGCAWVTEELSPAEQGIKLLECYNKNTPVDSTENSVKPNPGF